MHLDHSANGTGRIIDGRITDGTYYRRDILSMGRITDVTTRTSAPIMNSSMLASNDSCLALTYCNVKNRK